MDRWKRPETWTWMAVGLGFALRIYHYLRCPSVWHDEAALLVNVLGKSFREQLGPLFHAEAAPPLFLWVERAVYLLWNDGEYALRSVPLLASCASVVFVALMARRLTPGWPAALAVLLFSTSDRLLWHACEAKPYALDVCCAAGLAYLVQLTARSPSRSAVLAFLPLAPVVIWLIFPGCFLFGGVLLALLPGALRGRAPDRLAYVTLAAVVAASFLTLYWGPIRAQRCEAMDSCWIHLFPDWSRWWTFPVWAVASTFEVARYALMPLGHVLAPLAVVGAVRLDRAGHREWLVAAFAPVALVFVAACLHSYPYGAARVIAFATPALCLTVAAGAGPAFAWLNARSGRPGWLLPLALSVPILYGLYRTAEPWPRADCAAAAEFVEARRGPADPVVFNHWEYEYYFRDCRPAAYWAGGPLPEADRLWLIVSAALAEHRDGLIAALADDWRTAERHEFEGTTVVRLARRTADR